ncbi:MAG: ATP-binding cassette domain-containing protein [Verrucomicrobia bacterium]|nr:ATP-binding cassette domain-containing protein [Cytophagales bacterium]
MQATTLKTLLATLAELNNHSFNYFDLKEQLGQAAYNGQESIYTFIDDLTAKSQQIKLGVLSNGVAEEEFHKLLTELHYPIVVFETGNEGVFPIIIHKDKKNKSVFLRVDGELSENFIPNTNFIENLYTYRNQIDTEKDGKILFITTFPLSNLVTEPESDALKTSTTLTATQRFFRLLANEKKDIAYIYIYAVLVSLVGLTVPLGVQSIIGLISSGTVFSSIYVLIGLVILATIVSGILQIVQVTLVEHLQRKVFAQAAFEFAYRVPRIRAEALLKQYPPELMNRFFDILTIQKGLPKFLIDITAALLQILFGLVLLGFYNSSFILFGLFLLGLLVAMFIYTGPKGLKTSLVESKYKYKVVHWLEEIARTLYSFKLAGNTNLPLQKMDILVNSYLYYRKKHYKVLLWLMSNAVAFKVLVTGALLILGSVLVVDRQITLGQFVASEIVIILVIGAVEKLIMSLDVVYDLLTAVEKIGQVTDLPLEKETGFKNFNQVHKKGLEIEIKDLRYKYPESENFALKGVNLTIHSGEHICIAGETDAGKNTFTKIISGILDSYQGVITINGISLKSLNVSYLRDVIKKNISTYDIFNSTLLYNITMGRSTITQEDLMWAIEKVGLKDIINQMPEGLQTEITAGGKEFSESDLYRINLARCIITKPKLLIIRDFFHHFTKKEKMQLLSFLQDHTMPWTMMVVSNDPLVMASCDRIAIFSQGKVETQGSYQQLLADPAFQELLADNLELDYSESKYVIARNFDKG